VHEIFDSNFDGDFREEEEGEVWYYSTVLQLEELLLVLDPEDLESALCKELMEIKSEIIRQMEITEKITNQLKGSRKSYLEVENSHIQRLQKERSEQKALQNDISNDLELIRSKDPDNNLDNNVEKSEDANSSDDKPADDMPNQNKSILSSSICEELKRKLEDKNIDKQLDGNR